MTTTNQLDPITVTRADVLGYPKAASTFVSRFLQTHPQVTTDHNCVVHLLRTRQLSMPGITAKPCPNKIHISRDETVAESICVIGELEKWQRYKYKPGAWDRVKKDICLDPAEAALRLYKVHPEAKVLLLIREQADWLQSAYKYAISRLPATQRSFSDFCATPTGIAFLNAGHFDETINAYVAIFGSDRVCVLRFEDISDAPRRFAAELCAFIGISEQPLPQRRENAAHAQIARIRLKACAMRLVPGARRAILPSRDIRILRSIYAASNDRTARLLAQLSKFT
jgi:hypothetical protein